MSYRWTGSSNLVRGSDEEIEQGEAFEPTEAELEGFGDLIEEIDVTEDGYVDERSPGVDSGSKLDSFTSDSDGGQQTDNEDRRAQAEALADEHWRTAKANVENGDADDYLDELETIEDRSSVLKAIETRRDELE